MEDLGMALDVVEHMQEHAQSNSLAVRAYVGDESLDVAIEQTRKIENKEKIVGIFVVTEGYGAYADSAVRLYAPTETLISYVDKNYSGWCVDVEDAVATFEYVYKGVEFFTV